MAVERGEWEDRATTLVGLTAPELAASCMLNVAAIAALLRVKPGTVTSYVARGFLPGPTFSRNRQPLWSAGVLARHLIAARARRRAATAKRLLQPVRALTTVPSDATTAAPTAGPAPRLELDDLDRLLAQLGVDDDYDDDNDIEHNDDRDDDLIDLRYSDAR